MIDLRSDTVTKPTNEMLAFMFNAEVGDDVFSEDPSIIALEQKAASIFGKEAGIFCPSGTMTNQIGIKVLSEPPGEIICDELAHIYQYEGGGISFNSGLSVRLLNGDRGRLNANLVEAAVNPNDVHKAETQIISVENTCNKGGGSIYRFEDLSALSELSKKYGLKYHLDGARIFNALTEVDYTAEQVGQLFDTVSVCLSKGLGCPVGSVLLGSDDLISKARRIRKVLGGGMRQAGYLAAAGIYALDHHIDRLKEDHIRAGKISEILSGQNYVEEVMPVETNVVVFKLIEDLDLDIYLTKLEESGVKAVAFGPQLVRFVTHLDFSDDDLSQLEQIVNSFQN